MFHKLTPQQLEECQRNRREASIVLLRDYARMRHIARTCAVRIPHLEVFHREDHAPELARDAAEAVREIERNAGGDSAAAAHAYGQAINRHHAASLALMQHEKATPNGGEGDNASEMVALTPHEQAFFDVLNDEPQTGSDIVAKLKRQGYHHFDESKVSRISRRKHMQTRGVRNRPRAGYYILQSNSNLTAK